MSEAQGTTMSNEPILSVRNLVKRLEGLGLQVTLEPVAVVA